MNISRIICASISSMFVCGAWCMHNELVPVLAEKSVGNVSKCSVSQYAVRNGQGKCGVQCASFSNASPMYSYGTTAICKAIARKNAVESKFACYKQDNIGVKFSEDFVKSLLKKSYHENFNSSQRSLEQAEELLNSTKEFANKFFGKDEVIKNGTIDIGDFTENRIYTGAKVGWICSENSDEFVAKRLFGAALMERVPTLLGEWRRKFDATMNDGAVQSVLERIKSVEVLSGLLASAVCDEYENSILRNDPCQISRDFISCVYSKLNASFFGNASSEKYENIASLVDEIKQKYGLQDTTYNVDEFNLRNCFDVDTMRVFWGNFEEAFKSKKDEIINNALTGLKLYKVSEVLGTRLSAVKENGIASKIQKYDDMFYSSFNSNANIKFDNISLRLSDINVDLSLMIAINAVHAEYNNLLKKEDVKLNELYSSEVLDKLQVIRTEGDAQAANDESLYASVLASKIMGRFLYQACYAQYAYGYTPKEFLNMVCNSFFACNFGLKLSNSNFMDIDRLKEVLHTDGDTKIIDEVKKYHGLCSDLEKKIEAARPENIKKEHKEEKLAECMQHISLNTINAVLSSGSGSSVFKEIDKIRSALGYKKKIIGFKLYDSRGEKIGSAGWLISQFVKCETDSVLLGTSISENDGLNLINDKYKTTRVYIDKDLVRAFDYCFTNDAANKGGKEVFDDIKENIKKVFEGIYFQNGSVKTFPTEKYEDADWDVLTKLVIVMKFVPSTYDEKKQTHVSLLNAFKKRQEELRNGVVSQRQQNEIVLLEEQQKKKLKDIKDCLEKHGGKIQEYSANTYERALVKSDNGISQEKVVEAITKYNEEYAVEDIYLSAKSSWFFERCAEIRDILKQIAAQEKSTFSSDGYAISDDVDYKKVEDCIKKLASRWRNLKWLSAHQAVLKGGLAGVELSNSTSTGIGGVLEELLDVPVFLSTKDWVSNSGIKLPEKIDSENSKFICNILSRIHQDICSFFVSRVAATFLCNIFESNKDYSSLTESNAKTSSLILKSFSSSMVDFIADFYKMKECIDSSTGQNIANSSDLIIYAKDCLLSSTTCNKGVIAQVPDDLNKLTNARFETDKETGIYCSSMKGDKFIAPIADIKDIHFSLQDDIDNVGGEGSGCDVLKFSARNKDGMHPLSFVALVDFIRGKINFDQRMILLDSICIPVEGLFEKFQRVTKSGLLGEVPAGLTSVDNVLTSGDLGSVINYEPIENDLQKYHSVFWAESKNPFFVPENDRDKYGSGVDSIVTVTPTLLHSLRSDLIGDTKAWSLNDLIKKDIFSPQELQILLFLLSKSEGLACVNKVNKSVFYYLSHRERALIADCKGTLIGESSRPLTSKSVYVYKSPYFSPIFCKSEKFDSDESKNDRYNFYSEYSPFYFNIGDIGSRSIFGMLNTVMYQNSKHDRGQQQPKLGCLGNIIKNVDFYSGNTKINGDSVERLAKRYTNGLFNLPVNSDVSLDSVILNVDACEGKLKGFNINNFFEGDLTHFSDLLMFVGSVNLIGSGGGRFNNCQLEIMQGVYSPGFTSPKYRYACSVNGGGLSSLNDINSYKGFLLPAIGMLLTDKTSSFIAEKNYRKYTNMVSINTQYVEDILKGVDISRNGKDVFKQCFAYGLHSNRFRWEHGMYAAAKSLDKGDVLSSTWNVRYTINVQEKLNKLNEIINNRADQNNELFLYLADNEPKHIYKIAEIMCNASNQVDPTGVAISKNGEKFTYTAMLNYKESLIQPTDTSTECGFFYISPRIHQYIKQIVVDIYATKNTGDVEKKKAEWKSINKNEKVHMYAGVLYSLFAGGWKFLLGKYL